jgi:hypothetical protein
MSRWPGPVSVFLALTASLAGSAFAQGDGAPTSVALKECALAYENSQEHRGAGAISAARSEFERCRRDDCPAFIRNDCSRWSKELDLQQPTVIFSAKRGTRELIDVRVSTEDRVLLERLSNRAVELDPGEYDFRFEAAEGGIAIQHALIQIGNKDRLVQVEFAPLASAHAAAAKAPAPEKTVGAEPAKKQSATVHAPGPGVLPWALLAVGAASVGTGAGLSVWGHNEELELRKTCSPACTDSQVQPVRTKYLLSNISFGVGLVSLSAAAYLFLRHRDSEGAAETLPVNVIASSSSVQASYGARF